MRDWVFVTKQLLTDGNEAMLVPAMYSFRRKTKVQRIVCIATDLLYYTIRAAVLKTAFGV
jgi:hypothetical protein